MSDREKKILEPIGEGHSSAQIAFVLHISTHTVDSHRKNLLLKFDAKNSAELVRKSLQQDDSKDLN